MEKIGTTVIAAIGAARDLPPMPSGSCERPADSYDCDVALPRLFSAWTPSIGPREIRRALTDAERGKLTARVAVLRDALRPFESAEGLLVRAELAAMFSSFRSMRQAGEDVEATIDVTLRVLREFPQWAIAEACLSIARQDREWPPNDGQIHAAVESVLSSHRQRLKTCQALLDATVEATDPPKPTRAESEPTVARESSDGRHASRALADLELRRAQRETQGDAA
jgi:hypothetical protein